jgi:hypothetical protein
VLVQAAGDEERRVAEAQDLGEEHQEQQAAQQNRHADVSEPRGTPGRRVRSASVAGAQHDPVKQRVQRHQHEVVREDCP